MIQTGTSTYVVPVESFGISNTHGCPCQVCSILDKQDAEMLAIIRKYLSGEIDRHEFRLQEADVAYNRPNILHHFDSHPCSLADSVECLLVEAAPPFGDEEPYPEMWFKRCLSWLDYGYSIARRQEHLWKKQTPQNSDLAPKRRADPERPA